MKNVKEQNLEELLEAAGFTFTAVDRCPEPACEACVGQDLSAAA